MAKRDQDIELALEKSHKALSRRGFLHQTAIGACTVLAPGLWRKALATTENRNLKFQHTHRADELVVAYHRGGDYVPDGLEKINHFLRDHRTQEVYPIDPALLDFLHEVFMLTESRGAFQVVSGYRSPATNNMLRKQGRGVAKRSQHMLGKAIDVRLSDVDTATLRDAAMSLKRGGVGYYAKSSFVHLDTGRVRRW